MVRGRPKSPGKTADARVVFGQKQQFGKAAGLKTAVRQGVRAQRQPSTDHVPGKTAAARVSGAKTAVRQGGTAENQGSARRPPTWSVDGPSQSTGKTAAPHVSGAKTAVRQGGGAENRGSARRPPTWSVDGPSQSTGETAAPHVSGAKTPVRQGAKQSKQRFAHAVRGHAKSWATEVRTAYVPPHHTPYGLSTHLRAAAKRAWPDGLVCTHGWSDGCRGMATTRDGRAS